MTKDDALKLALVALEATLNTLITANEQGLITDTIWFSNHETLFDSIASEIDQIKEALAQPAQEPVAWRYRGNLHEFDPSDWATGPVTPLYTAPPQPAQEPIKQVLDAEFNRGYKEGVRDAYAKSPQRPWVGLTDKEKKEIYRLSVYVEGAISLTEAKLKEKNT